MNYTEVLLKSNKGIFLQNFWYEMSDGKSYPDGYTLLSEDVIIESDHIEDFLPDLDWIVDNLLL